MFIIINIFKLLVIYVQRKVSRSVYVPKKKMEKNFEK